MATTTSGNLALTKPTYSESADIGVINTNMDTIDSAVSGLDGALAIVATGTTAPQAISSGQFVLWRNALYKATTAIASGATLSTSNLTAVSGGGLNALNSSLTNLQTEIDDIHPGNAGAHNCIYRGKYLGSSVSSAQWSAISAGTFDDMYVGDYWTINGVAWRIAGFDYWYRTGDSQCTTHHAVIVPDSNLASAPMNSTNITTGAYIGSDMYTGANSNTGLSTAKSTINSAFGSGHILSHRQLFANAASNGAPSGWAWYDSTVDLMNEQMVYGGRAWGNTAGAGNGYDVGIDKSQLPLFVHEPSRITNRAYWWLRSVVSASYFACVTYYGLADRAGASSSIGVRPAFGICQS